MNKRLISIIFIAIVLIGGILFPDIFWETSGQLSASDDLEVHFIDVGQGESILIKTNVENMLIDSGSNGYSDFLIDYLNNQGISKLDYVVATHPHEDHIGSMDEVIDYFNIGKVIMPNVTHTSRAFENVIDSIDRNNLTITVASPYDTYDIGGAEAVVLAPLSDNYSSLNNYSLVIKLINGANSFLFTGDAEEISENEMLENDYNILKSDVLNLGHHGSSTSTTEEFFKAVDPDYGVISVAEGNTYGHPHREIVEVLESNDVEYYRTDIDGNIIFTSDGENISIIK